MQTSQKIDVAVGILLGPHRGKPEQVLIARRDRANAVLGGYWEFPGGKCEVGEEPAACLVREFEEELGVQVAVEAALGVIEHVYDHGMVRLWPFVCQLVAGEPRPLAASEVRWVRPRELGDYRFPEANVGLVREVVAWMAGIEQSQESD